MKYFRLRSAKRIVILCEGETEVLAVKHFIQRQWEKDGLKSIGLQTDDLRAKLDDVYTKVPLHLKNPKVIAVFTLIDLYEMKRVIYGRYDPLNDKVEKAKKWLKNDYPKDILERFFPHLSVYEVEAWILGEGDALKKRLKDPEISPENNAEEKNDQNPPKARLNKIFRKHGRRDGFKEIRDGTPLFKVLNFEKVYKSCPYFRNFYDELKKIGKSIVV